VPPGGRPFAEALKAIDVQRLRSELHATMVTDVLSAASGILARARNSLEELRRYTAALQGVQNLCLQEALRYFPWTG